MPVELLILQGRWAMIRETMDPPPERAVGSPVPSTAQRVLISGDRLLWFPETNPAADRSQTFLIRVGSSKEFAGVPGLAEIDLIRGDGTRLVGLMAILESKKGGDFRVMLCFSSERGMGPVSERPKEFKATAGQTLYTLLPLPGDADEPNAEKHLRVKLQVSRDLLDTQKQLDQAEVAIANARRRLLEAQAAEPAVRARREELALFLRKTAEIAEARANRPGPDTAKAPARDLPDDARAKAEAERQRDLATEMAADAERARAALGVAKRRAEVAEAKLAELTRQLQAERDQARSAEQAARAAAERAQHNERIAREALEKATGAKPEPKVQTVSVADANGKTLPIPEDLQPKIEEQAVAVFTKAGGELASGSPGGTEFATAELWKRAEKGPHVKIHFPQKRSWPGNSLIGNAGVSDILIPMTDRRAPDYVLTRDGDTYRAFYNLPESVVKDLQKLLAELK
jgi:hypothetical protein